MPPPYVIALVELEEQAGLRVVGNLIGVDDGELRIDLPVRVAFEIHGEHAVPVWGPATTP